MKIKERNKKEQSIPLDKKKAFCKIVAERTGKIEKLHNSVNFENLIYNFKDHTKDIDFNYFINAATPSDYIKSKKNKIWRCRKKSNWIWIKIKSCR